MPHLKSSKTSDHKNKVDRPIQEESAGGIVFKKTAKGFFVAMMVDSYGKWTFPKGHVEKGESKEEAAARETIEEIGLDEIKLLETLGSIDIEFTDRFEKKGKTIQKTIHYYLFQAPANARIYPEEPERVFQTEWVPKSHVLKRSEYKDMVEVVKTALAFLNKKYR